MRSPSHDHLLAFDLGTTGNKVVLIDAESGRVVETESSTYPTAHAPGGRVEQSPDDWWNSTVRCCRAVADRNPEALARVAAIACTGMMNGIVAVDKAGQALRPSIIHADTRSTAQVKTLVDRVGAAEITRSTSNRPDCRLSLSKAMWLAEFEPETLARAASIVQAKDYLAGRLTGRPGVTDPSDASLTGAFDVDRRVWLREIWSEAGLPVRLLPEVVPSAQVIGHVTAAAASALGLRAGIPVVAGGGDGPCATAGSGVGPGEGYHYLGSSSWIGLNAAAPIVDDRLSHYCSLDERVTVFGTVQAAGTSLEWFSTVFSGRSTHADLDIDAARVPPGANDLFFLPYLQGERAPLWDAAARGVFFGLTPSHGRAEMYRAVLEGVGYALRSILDVYAENGHPLPTLRQLGGGAKSDLWRSMLAAIFERKLLSVEGVSSATSLGAAMAAGVGAGMWPSIAEAGAHLTSIADETAPDTALVAAYQPRMAFYRTLYPVLKDRFEALSMLGDNG